MGEHKQCVKILLEAGASANVSDNKGGQTPLILAANKRNLDIVKLLLKYGADLRGDAERILTSNFSGHQIAMLDLDSVKRRQTEEDITEKLYKLIDIAELDGEDVVKFRQLVSKTTNSELDSIIGKMSMIQACAERGLASYVSILLSSGADPNITTIMKPTTAFLLAATGGKADVIKVMLNHNSLNSNNNTNKMVETLSSDQQFNQTVLHQLLRKPLNNLELSKQKFENTNYEKCFDILLKQQNNLTSIINMQDIHGNTALHYATQFWDNDTVTKLLLIGANIGLRNSLGETPISNILPATMENFLNQHCIKSQGNPTNEDFKISFHYDFLAPPRDENTDLIRMPDSEDMANKKTPPQPETDVLWYMAKSKDHCHLLKHPVITSFLALKWSRISFHYNTNMIFSTLLVAMLTIYIFTNYAGKVEKTQFCLFNLSLLGFSLGVEPPECHNTTRIEETADENWKWGNSIALWWATTVLMVLLVIREGLQFSVNPSQYLASVENLLEILMMVLTFVLLFNGPPGCYLEFKREIATSVLLISWILMVTMIGILIVIF